MLDQQSLKDLDDADIGDVVEVHWYNDECDFRTSVGHFSGFLKQGREWYLLVRGKLTVRMIDVSGFRRLKTPADIH